MGKLKLDTDRSTGQEGKGERRQGLDHTVTTHTQRQREHMYPPSLDLGLGRTTKV